MKRETKVLFLASFTEFGERYGYYVIQSLLIFYLIAKYKISEAESYSLIGTVLSLIYISAIVGGLIADRFLGYYRSAILGAIFMLVGNLVLALGGNLTALSLGLAFIAISTGLIKSNMSSFLGGFYDKQADLSPSRRDFWFNIFYIGINLGSLFALGVASSLKDHLGDSAPFYSCLIIICLILVNLLYGFRMIKQEFQLSSSSLKQYFLALLISLAYIVMVFFILMFQSLANFTILVASTFCLYILVASARGGYLKNALNSAIYFGLSILYWALYFQIFLSILLFIDLGVNHNLLGLNLANSQFLSFESLGVIVLGGLVGRFWLFMERKSKQVSDIDKFNLGFICIIISFGLFYIVLELFPAKLPALVIVISFLILALSELFLSASGLAIITKIAPPKFVSLYMGLWLVSLGLGGKLGGFLSTNMLFMKNDLIKNKAIMATGLIYFMFYALIGILICLVFRRFCIKFSRQLEIEKS